MNIKSRRYVTFVAMLLLVSAVVSCENSTGNKDNGKKPASRTIFTKANKAKNAANLSDSTVVSDALPSQEAPDSTTQTIATANDTAYLELPILQDETDIDLVNTDEADTLDYVETYIEEDLSDRTDKEFEEETEYDESEEEYVGYTSGDVTLNKERILKTEVVDVQFPEIFDERDSVLAVIEERMSLNPDQVSKQIVVEKWYSPVNYRGYKFNRKKLMLYGMDKAAPVDVYFYLGDYYLAVYKRVYNLDETAKNKNFIVVRDSVLAAYLLNY